MWVVSIAHGVPGTGRVAAGGCFHASGGHAKCQSDVDEVKLQLSSHPSSQLESFRLWTLSYNVASFPLVVQVL